MLMLLMVLSGARAKGLQPSAVFFAVHAGALDEIKARLAAHDQALQPALQSLVRAADKAMQVDPPSVMEKTKTPPGGDRHDYMTIAPYYWPDPTKPDGLPYIRNDGKVNPESREDAFDHGRLALMTRTVETLALAYYYTTNEAYAEHAAKFLRVWFLDPATKMNPNLEFSQAVLGENTGRSIGIIEGRNIAVVADAAGLLAGCIAWKPEDQLAFKAWLVKYFDWLQNSRHGREESNARNNHGTFYDVQAVELALVLGKTEVARNFCDTAITKRIAAQIEADGRQPLELERTASLSYSHFNL